MKTLIISILCLMLATSHAGNDPKPAAAAPVILGCLVLVMGATAVYVVIKCYSTDDRDNGPVNVVLERSLDHSEWVPVVTNRVELRGREPIEVFQDTRRNDGAFYRAKLLPN